MRGGYNSVELLKQWRDVVRALGLDAAAASNHAAMKLLYERCLLDFEHYLRTPGLLGEGGGEGWEWKGVGGVYVGGRPGCQPCCGAPAGAYVPTHITARTHQQAQGCMVCDVCTGCVRPPVTKLSEKCVCTQPLWLSCLASLRTQQQAAARRYVP